MCTIVVDECRFVPVCTDLYQLAYLLLDRPGGRCHRFGVIDDRFQSSEGGSDLLFSLLVDSAGNESPLGGLRNLRQAAKIGKDYKVWRGGVPAGGAPLP